MMTDTERNNRIETLTPRQALDIIQYMTAWLDEKSPDTQSFTAQQQIDILNRLFEERGYAPLPLSPSAKPDEQTAGRAARRLLVALAASPDNALLAELERWLAKPPQPQTKAVAEVMAVSAILTACTVALGTNFEFKRDDKGWRIEITRTAPTGKNLEAVLKRFYAALGCLIGLG